MNPQNQKFMLWREAPKKIRIWPPHEENHSYTPGVKFTEVGAVAPPGYALESETLKTSVLRDDSYIFENIQFNLIWLISEFIILMKIVNLNEITIIYLR